jgi:hypothetical protein
MLECNAIEQWHQNMKTRRQRLHVLTHTLNDVGRAIRDDYRGFGKEVHDHHRENDRNRYHRRITS